MAIFIAFGIFSSCKEEVIIVVDSMQKRDFLSSDRPGYYLDGKPMFLLSDSLHQVCNNHSRKLFRVQTNEQDTSLNVILESIPNNIGVHILTTVTYLDPSNKSTNKIMMECSQMTEERVWFWDPQTYTGIILPKK